MTTQTCRPGPFCHQIPLYLLLNERVLDTLPREVRTYISTDSVKCDNEEERQNYPTEFLNSLTPSGMPPHRAQPQGQCNNDASEEFIAAARNVQWHTA